MTASQNSSKSKRGVEYWNHRYRLFRMMADSTGFPSYRAFARVESGDNEIGPATLERPGPRPSEGPR